MNRVLTWLKIRYYVWMPFAVVVILFGCNLVYTNYAIHRSDQELCGLLLPLEQANRHTPPTTAFGRTYAAELHRQVIERDC